MKNKSFRQIERELGEHVFEFVARRDGQTCAHSASRLKQHLAKKGWSPSANELERALDIAKVTFHKMPRRWRNSEEALRTPPQSA